MEAAMKFICLGYSDEKKWEAMSKNEQGAMMEECFAYDEKLGKDGHWVEGGLALQSTRTGKILRWKNGKVLVTDGPFAETKEQLGGLGVLEARDMEHAVELISEHPGIRFGPFEIRPVDEEALKRRMEAAVAAKLQAGTMKFAILGYIPWHGWDAIPENEKAAMMEECVAFDKARSRDGQWISGIALQGAATAKTVRSKGGKVLITDGPFAETKEQLGGVVVNQLRDMPHAVELLSTNPALRFGVVIEIRPLDEEMHALWEDRVARLKTMPR